MLFHRNKAETEEIVIDKSDRYIVLSILCQVLCGAFLFMKSSTAAVNFLMILIPMLIVTAFAGTYTYNKDGDMKLFFACSVLSAVGVSLQLYIDQVFHPFASFSLVKYMISFLFTFVFIVFYRIFRKILDKSFTMVLTILLSGAIYVLLYFYGIDPNGYGTRAWLNAGPFTIQLTDFTKISALLFYSALFSEKSHRSNLFILVISSLFFGLNLFGSIIIHELGSFFILFILHLSILTIYLPHSTGKRVYLILVFLLIITAVAFSFIGYKILLPYAEAGTLNRIQSMLWPVIKKVYVRFSLTANLTADPYGSGYQLLQAKKALWMSGLTGNTVHFTALPVPESDMAFISLAVCFGLPAAFFSVFLFLRIFLSGCALSRKLAGTNLQDSVVTYGISVMLFLQAMIVILGSCNVIPFTGLPIPFLSRGGTYQAIVFSFAGLLIFMSQKNGQRYAESEVESDATEQLEIPYRNENPAQ